MPKRYPSAVVLGASMSGLLAARALSRHFEQVTLVERDPLPERDEARKGVPQNLLASPPSLMSPGVAWRVLARSAPRGEGSPWGTKRLVPS